MTEKMELWDQVFNSPAEWLKKVSMRGGYVVVDAYHQLQRATELWGPYGSTWGIKEAAYGFVVDEGKIKEIYLDAFFVYPGGQFPVSVDMVYKAGQECRKKLRTQAQSKALSFLGFNADVYQGRWEDADERDLGKNAVRAKEAPATGRRSLMTELTDAMHKLVSDGVFDSVGDIAAVLRDEFDVESSKNLTDAQLKKATALLKSGKVKPAKPNPEIANCRKALQEALAKLDPDVSDKILSKAGIDNLGTCKDVKKMFKAMELLEKEQK